MIKKSLLILFSAFNFLLISGGYSQGVFESTSKTTIYNFLDELANDQIITLTSVVKPYTRTYIAEKLKEASKSDRLNKRQKNEIYFFLKDYGLETDNKIPAPVFFNIFKNKTNTSVTINPPGFYYADSLFRFGCRPVLGIECFKNDNGLIYHRFNGAEAFADIDKRVSFYASLVDNNESEMLAKQQFLTQRTGANYKQNVNGSGRNDFSEMRGGIMYNWKWGNVGLVKDQLIWGNNYNGSIIFSGRTPSFAQIKLCMSPVKWFKFNYIHGWLVSSVIDSSRSYYDSQKVYRGVYHDKYLAANMFTFTPFKNLDLSFGNSIVYSDIGVQPAYLIPVMFFKSIDHTLNSTVNNLGQNSQMFFDISTRQIPHTHLFASLFVDEIMLSTIFDQPKSRNQLSLKAGFKVNNIIPNVFIIGEYTRNNPWSYRHYISTTTFASNTYNLGNYLRDNSEAYYVAIGYQPLRGLNIMADYSKALKGEEYVHSTGSAFDTGTPFIKEVFWRNESYSLKATYDILNNVKIFSSFIYSEIKDKSGLYTPDFFKGVNRTLSFGLNVGL